MYIFRLFVKKIFKLLPNPLTYHSKRNSQKENLLKDEISFFMESNGAPMGRGPPSPKENLLKFFQDKELQLLMRIMLDTKGP